MTDGVTDTDTDKLTGPREKNQTIFRSENRVIKIDQFLQEKKTFF